MVELAPGWRWQPGFVGSVKQPTVVTDPDIGVNPQALLPCVLAGQARLAAVVVSLGSGVSIDVALRDGQRFSCHARVSLAWQR